MFDHRFDAFRKFESTYYFVWVLVWCTWLGLDRFRSRSFRDRGVLSIFICGDGAYHKSCFLFFFFLSIFFFYRDHDGSPSLFRCFSLFQETSSFLLLFIGIWWVFCRIITAECSTLLVETRDFVNLKLVFWYFFIYYYFFFLQETCKGLGPASPDKTYYKYASLSWIYLVFSLP